MTLDALVRPWAGAAFRHIPAASPYGVLDFRFAGRASNNRWNHQGEPTLYLAGDRAVALAEFARHLQEDRSAAIQAGMNERAVFRLDVAVDALIDLRDPAVQHALSLKDAPICFLDRDVARATALFLRRTTAAQALQVPSVAFLDDPTRWVLTLFLDKLPDDHRRFIRGVEPDGHFRVSP